MKEILIGVLILLTILLLLNLGSDEHEITERDKALQQKADEEDRNGD